jgi:hypothetical protein
MDIPFWKICCGIFQSHRVTCETSQLVKNKDKKTNSRYNILFMKQLSMLTGRSLYFSKPYLSKKNFKNFQFS